MAQKKAENKEIDAKNHAWNVEARIIRLHYFNSQLVCDGVKEPYKVKTVDKTLDRFEVPEGVYIDEIFNLISYIKQYFEKENNIRANSLLATQFTNNTLPDYHFKLLKKNEKKDLPCLDLYVIDGDKRLFIKSREHKKYFMWEHPNPDFDWTKAVFEKFGYTIPDQPKIYIESAKNEKFNNQTPIELEA